MIETTVTAARERPSPAALQEAATVLMSRHVAVLRAAARPYARTHEDLEDAVQRGVEILLVKAPTADIEELLPWLRTVVKHEAIAIWRRDRRMLPSEELDEIDVPAEPSLQDRIDDRSDFDEGIEALARLKPDEMRCLLLKAAGLSYDEICTETEFSYTKVNRCLTEGRASFRRRLHGIRSGQECERLAPLLSRVADGEATHDDLRMLRPHLRRCSVCKATLREYRAVPERIAALVPPLALTVRSHRSVGRFLVRAIAWAQRRSAALGLARTGGAHVAAVAASVAVIAGGTAAVTHKAVRSPAANPGATHTPTVARSASAGKRAGASRSGSTTSRALPAGPTVRRHRHHVMHRRAAERRAPQHIAYRRLVPATSTGGSPSSTSSVTSAAPAFARPPSARQPVEFGP